MQTQTPIQQWSDIVYFSASELWRALAVYLPSLLGAIALLVIGLVIARFLARLTKAVFEIAAVKKFVKASRVNEAIKSAGIETTLVQIIATIVYWLVMVVFILSISDVLGLVVVVETLNQLLAYIPNVVAAVIVFILAFAVAKLVRDAVVAGLKQVDFAHSQTIGSLAGGVVVLFGTLIAASQLGLDVSILHANVTVIVAGLVTTLVLAVGLGSRGLVANLIGGYYTKQMFRKGQPVILAGTKGKVKEINNIVVILETGEGDVIIPNKEIIERGSL